MRCTLPQSFYCNDVSGSIETNLYSFKNIIDEALASQIRIIAKSNCKPSVNSSLRSESFCPGDLVRLRKGLAGSSVQTVWVSIDGRPTLSLNESQSSACLGSSEQRRFGIVVGSTTIRGATLGSRQSVIRVASVLSKHICEYSPSDLVYADGSTPPTPHPPLTSDFAAAINQLPSSAPRPTHSPQSTSSTLRRPQASQAGSLRVGDRVVLRESSPASGSAALLANGAVGVVLVYLDGGRAPVIVSLSGDPSRCGAFHADSLRRVPACRESQVRPGDVVQINPTSTQDPELTGCLGSVERGRFGVVVSEGVIRGGLRRNVEVATAASDDDVLTLSHLPPPTPQQQPDRAEKRCRVGRRKRAAPPKVNSAPTGQGGDMEVRLSHYSGAVLVPAARAAVLTRSDRATLVEAVRGLARRAGLGEGLDVEGLERRFGAGVWGRLWRVCAQRCGEAAVVEAFIGWQVSRLPGLPQAQEVRASLHRLCDPENSSISAYTSEYTASMRRCLLGMSGGVVDGGPGAGAPGTTLWTCGACFFNENPGTAQACRLCHQRAERWTCATCGSRYRLGTAFCGFCRSPRPHDVGEKLEGVGTESVGGLVLQHEVGLSGLSNAVTVEDLWDDLAVLRAPTPAAVRVQAGVGAAHIAYTDASDARAAAELLGDVAIALAAGVGSQMLLARSARPGKVPRVKAKGRQLYRDGRPFEEWVCTVCRRPTPTDRDRCITRGCNAQPPSWLREGLRALGLHWLHPGDIVVLSASAAVGSDGTTAGLAPGELGRVMQVRGKGEAFRVVRATGPTEGGPRTEDGWWYEGRDVELVAALPAGSVPRLSAWPAWVRLPPQPWQAAGNETGGSPSSGHESTLGAKFLVNIGKNKPVRGNDGPEFAGGLGASEKEVESSSNSDNKDGVDDSEQAVARLNTLIAAASALYTVTARADSPPPAMPITCLEGLVGWVDAQGRTCAHHAAAAGLQAALDALYAAGASRWTPDARGITPALLADGLAPSNWMEEGLEEDEFRRARTLHRACVEGGLLLPAACCVDPVGLRALARAAVQTPANWNPPLEIEDAWKALHGVSPDACGCWAETPGKTVVELLRAFLGRSVHARAYLAAALAEEPGGFASAQRELQRYLADLLLSSEANGCSAPSAVDPVFYYGTYRAWEEEAVAGDSGARVRVSHALVALGCFPNAFARLLASTRDQEGAV